MPVILDMKGRQYSGRIFPGPSALILGTQSAPVGKPVDESETPQLKVLGMTDEFVRCVQQGDTLDRLSAALEKGKDDGASAVLAPVSDKKPAAVASKTKSSAKKTKSTTGAS